MYRLIILLQLVCVFAFGQTGLGSISGAVVDQSDAPIPRVTVKIRQLSTNTERTTETNAAGLFTVPSLVASQYEIALSAPGFKTATVADLRLNSSQNLSLGRITLEVGADTVTTVEVSGEIPAIVTENAVRNETIQSKQVTEMPLQGRNWTTLLKIIPGSTPQNTSAINGREASYDGYADFRINGKAPNQTQVNLDGGSNVDHGSDTKTTVTPSLESIQEVSVLTNNFQAEYGNRAGVVINIITKSGTNNWNGTVWNYMRNEALNARPWDRAFFNQPNPRYRYNYFGGNLGGPIKKDKLFFFVNHETLKQDTPTLSNQIRVPTELERNGDFSQTVNANGTRPTIYMPGTQASGAPVLVPNNIIPQNLIHPVGRAIMNLYPAPNLKNETNNNYLNQYAKEDKRWLNVGKIDWNIDDSMRAYFRYSYDYQYYRDMVTWAAGSNLPFINTGWNRPDHAFVVNLTKTWSASMVSETMFNWQKDYVNATLDVMKDPSAIDITKRGLADLPLAFPNKSNILPQVQGTGYQDFQFNRFPWYAKAPEYQITHNMSLIKGTHLFKWGVQYILNKKDEINASVQKGNFNFGVDSASEFDTGYSPANILVGAVSQFTQVDNQSRKFSKYQDFHVFIQDTWKVTPTLTLDYGIRLYHIPSEFNTDQNISRDAVFLPSLYDPAKAPRFYIVNPKNTKTLIDPKFPDNPLPAGQFAALLYSLVPGSGEQRNGVVPLGGSYGGAGIRNPGYILFAPRGGIAWNFTPKTVLRVGFGWSYNRPTITQATGTFQNGMAEQIDYRQTSLSTLHNPTVTRLSPLAFGARDESSNAVPTVYDFSFSIQRELPAGIVLDAAYIGNLQRHQTMQFNINQVLPGTAWNPAYKDPRLAGNNFAGPVSASNPGPLPGTQTVNADLMRPFYGFGALNLITNVGNNRYNSLQWSLNKRYSHGLTFQFVHTWGKLITGIENPGPFYANWKKYTNYVADQHRVHVVGINYTYDVPSLAEKMGWQSGVAKQVFSGWTLAHLMNFYSGRALTPTFGLQYANNTQGVANLNAIFTGSPDVAPRIVPSRNVNTGSDDVAHLFDIAPFGVPAFGDGTGSRNYLWTPGTFSNDINLSKTFPIRERTELEMRASFFNPFNQVRRQDLNTAFTFKMKGRTLADGYMLNNSPEQNVANLLASKPGATELEKYNQFRGGVGHANMTSVMDMRRIEIGLRLRF
ncbi:MAG: TonB-dependent receptor [Bryobacterales bacterium]|nr:TonB-dependent receptor [Bryobacterales bacterium]